jgi:hypothetical protein
LSYIIHAFPLSDKFRTPEAVLWLGELQIPADAQNGRNPTQQEMQQVLQSFEEATLEVTPYEWKFNFPASGNWVRIEVRSSDDEDAPCSFVFRGDGAIVIEIARKLSTLCGSFVLTAEGEPFEVIIAF